MAPYFKFLLYWQQCQHQTDLRKPQSKDSSQKASHLNCSCQSESRFFQKVITFNSTFVIAILVLLDQAFEADVATDLKILVPTLQEKKESGDPVVAITKWMDAERESRLKAAMAMSGWIQRSSRQRCQSAISCAMCCGVSSAEMVRKRTRSRPSG